VSQWQYTGETAVRKEYLTLVEGVPAAAEGVVNERVDGLPARSEWHLEEAFHGPGESRVCLSGVSGTWKRPSTDPVSPASASVEWVELRCDSWGFPRTRPCRVSEHPAGVI
jgi:hypothetical protein